MGDVKSERLEYEHRLSPVPAHSLSDCPTTQSPWRLDKAPTSSLFHDGGTFPTGTPTGLLGTQTTPYRTWAPPAAHAAVYSLFPNGDALYSPNARFHPTLSHPKDLYLAASPPVYHQQLPTNVVQQPVERSIAHLELMAKGFNNNNNNNNVNVTNNNNNTKRYDNRCSTPSGQATKRRWDGLDVTVKEEAPSRGCACHHSPVARPILPREASPFDRKRATAAEGCSRTNPVALRANVGGHDACDATWQSGVGVVVKKEPGGVGTPCQVAEVTTSVASAGVKAEDVAKDLTTSGATIPVGIAVARQRNQEKVATTTHALCNISVQSELQGSALSTMALVAPHCTDDRLTNGMATWAGTNAQATPTSSLWQYPALGVEPMAPLGYQLVREPLTGQLLLIPAASVLWPTYHPAEQPVQGFEQRLLIAQPQTMGHTMTQMSPAQSVQSTVQSTVQTVQPRPNASPKRRAPRLKEEKPSPFACAPFPATDHVAPAETAGPQTAVIQHSRSTSPPAQSSPLTPSLPIAASSPPAPSPSPRLPTPVAVQDASNQTDTPDDEFVDIDVEDVASRTVTCARTWTPPAAAKPEVRSEPPVDLSGLELLSNSIAQFESQCRPADDAVESSSDASSDITEERAAETLQLLAAGSVFKRESALRESRNSFCEVKNLSVCDDRARKPFEDKIVSCDSGTAEYDAICDVKKPFEGLVALNEVIRASRFENDPFNAVSRPSAAEDGALGGLGLLCALAEQRFMDEVDREPTSSSNELNERIVYKNESKEQRKCVKLEECDVERRFADRAELDAANAEVARLMAETGRSYKSREAERECRRFIASKVQQSYQSGPESPTPCPSPPINEHMDPAELAMRLRLADIQRKYREKQRELSRLTPKKSDSDSSPTKRGPGRPRKKGNKLASDSPPDSPKVKAKREVPPVLEACATEKPKTVKPDILKPPTLTANRILTSAKFRPEMKTKTKAGGGGVGAKTKETDKTERAKGKTDAADKKSGFQCSRASHTFGSKPPARLPRPGENESLFWFKCSPEPTPVPPPDATPALLTALPIAASSSSKKRKVGRPKKHLTSGWVATETIVAKKPRGKGGLAGFLMGKARRLSSSDVPSSFKSANAAFSAPKPADRLPPLPVEFPANGCPNGEATSDAPHKILPKLKAEAKVRTWADDEDIADWPTITKEDKLPSKPPANVLKRKSSTAAKPETPKKVVKKPPAPPAPKPAVAAVKVVVEPPSPPTPTPSQPKKKTESMNPANKKAAETTMSANKKRAKRESSCSSNSSPTTTESDDIPLSNFATKKPDCRCLLTEQHLETERLRALTLTAGLFYAGELRPIQPPDVYGIRLDGERGNKPHILTREEVLNDAILEVRVSSISELPPGKRVCAYWSQQYRCLYPGTVAPSDDDTHAALVSVEFDDGDNGRIGVDDIRLLPDDYPIVEYDPNPLLTLGRRKRQASGASCDSQSRRPSAEVAPPPPPLPPPPPPLAVVDQAKDTAAENAENVDNSKERKRLKKRRRDKLKRLNALPADGSASRGHRKHKHRCCDERCRHRRRHRRHRKHKHRDSDRHDSDALSSRLSPVLEQLDILEIQQTAIRQLTSRNEMQRDAEKKSHARKEKDAKKDAKEAKKDVKEAKKDVQERKEESVEVEVTEEDREPEPEAKKAKRDAGGGGKKPRDRQPSTESKSKMAAFLPARQLWGWAGRGFKRPGARGRGKKEFFKSIQRGKETIMVGDSAVFLSTGRPDRPYIGRIESMWESWGTNMVVKVKWFYHPEETVGCPAKLKLPGALFESPHVDENDVQTISHKCEVLPLAGYAARVGSEPDRLAAIYDNNDIYYQAGYYDPTTSQLKIEKGVV